MAVGVNTNVNSFDDVRQALNTIVHKLNELSATEANYGASLIGIKDNGDYFTGTTVEAALQEVAAAAGM